MSLLKLDIDELTFITIKLLRFLNILIKNYQDNDLLHYFDAVQNENIKQINKSTLNRKQGRRGEFARLKNKNHLILIFSFVLLTVMIVIFSIIFIVLSQFNQARKVQIAQELSATNSMNQFNFAIASLNEFISENRTTNVQGQDISTSLNRTFSTLSNTGNLIESFSDADGLINSEFIYYISGDFCSFGTTIQKEFCSLSLTSPAKMGLVGINNYISFTLQKLKLNYLISNQTKQDVQNILSSEDFFYVNVLDYIYAKPAYNNINDCLTQDFQNYMKLIGNSMILMACIASGIIVAISIIYRKTIYTIMKDQENSLKAILKLLPINMITSSNFLKHYLVRTSMATLSEIKSKL